LPSRGEIDKIIHESEDEGGYTMKAIMGTVHNGQIVADQPVEWPEGCRVVIELEAREDTLGIREEDWPTTPEALADWLAWFDSLEPVELTPEEEAAWQADRKTRKEWEKANFKKWSRQIEELFE
jgi:hypothetical protein